MRYLLVILLPLLLVSCRKEETPQFTSDKLDGEKEILVGTWEWIYTKHSYNICNPNYEVKEILNPTTESKTYQLTIDKEGYVNFNGVSTERVVIVYWKKEIQSSSGREYSFGSFVNNVQDLEMGGGVGHDTLILLGTYANEPFSSIGCDGCCRYTNYFVKI